MKTLSDPQCKQEILSRVRKVRADSPRQWGKMNAAQAVAHSAASMEWAVGDRTPPRMVLASLLGRVIKKKVLGNDAPFRRNSPTAPDPIVPGQPNIDIERNRLIALIDRFTSSGPSGCTKDPHSFFGPLTPDEWAILTYKHLDHHLRQFGV